MQRPWPVTRRSVVLLAATWLLDRGVGSLFARDAGSSAGKADLPQAVGVSKFRFRHYAVNATVIFASIPIFTRARVGGALLSIEEQGGSERGAIGLQFGAGSWPERSHGLNRFGMTQELVRIDDCNIAESNYFSFMTSCRESNFSQAEQAFRSAADCLPLTIARGRSTAAGCSAKLMHEVVSANLSWADCPKLSDELRQRIPPVSGNAEPGYNREPLPTFLYAVRRAASQNSQNATTLYAHNGEVYRLRTQVRCDAVSGEHVVTGQTSRPGARGESEFKLWMAPSDPDFPRRIEFRPKSYLKLTLEADERQERPLFKPLFAEAQL